MPQPIRVTVWNEFRHEKKRDDVRAIYPKGIHATVAEALTRHLGAAVTVRTATLDETDHGLSDKVLAETDVMTWWGHGAHHEVRDEIAEKVQKRVLQGMGLIALHSAHYSKPFKRLMGTDCGLRWREAGEKEIIWCVNPGHPIADGLTEDHFTLPHVEMYGEPFQVPTPEELVFISWFQGGEVFRSGCTWTRGKGKIFFFRPGHETYPLYHDANVQRVIANAVRWAAPASGCPLLDGCLQMKQPLMPIPNKAQSSF